MDSVLITGGAGFIGSHAAEAFHRAGWNVRVLDDLSSGRRENLAALQGERGVEFIAGSVTDAAAVQAAASGMDLVVHLAAQVSVPLSIERPRDSLMRNVVGTFNVFDACRLHPDRCGLVFASSAAVYGDRARSPIREAESPSPLSPYAADKLYAEHLAAAFAHAYGLRSIGLRLFNVYGPRQDPASPYSGVISKFETALRSGAPCTIHGDGLQTRDFVHVGDVAAALLRAGRALRQAAQGAPGAVIYNVGSGRTITIRELHTLMAGLHGRTGAPVEAPAQRGDVRDSCADIRAIQAALGWAPTMPLEQGLAQMRAAR